MTNISSSKKKPGQSRSSSNIKIDRRKELRLELPLPVMVEGKLPQGKKFKEETSLQDISATGAYFCLDSKVTVGSNLHLEVEVPNELTKDKKTNLSLNGSVIRLEKLSEKEKKQGVALRFNKKHRFITQ
ncbi:PilZ domain-containing protein [bacterium]|nr:PilZ domain-containing protein [bacterium]